MHYIVFVVAEGGGGLNIAFNCDEYEQAGVLCSPNGIYNSLLE